MVDMAPRCQEEIQPQAAGCSERKVSEQQDSLSQSFPWSKSLIKHIESALGGEQMGQS